MSEELTLETKIVELVYTKDNLIKPRRYITIGELCNEQNRMKHVITGAIRTNRAFKGRIYCRPEYVENRMEILQDSDDKAYRFMLYNPTGELNQHLLSDVLVGVARSLLYNFHEIVGYDLQKTLKSVIIKQLVEDKKTSIVTPTGHVITRITPHEILKDLKRYDIFTEHDVKTNVRWRLLDEYKVGLTGSLSLFRSGIYHSDAIVCKPPIGATSRGIDSSVRLGKPIHKFLYTLNGRRPDPTSNFKDTTILLVRYNEDGKIDHRCHPTLGTKVTQMAPLLNMSANKLRNLFKCYMTGKKRYNLRKVPTGYLLEVTAFEIRRQLTHDQMNNATPLYIR
jgi:hypothetical protein